MMVRVAKIAAIGAAAMFAALFVGWWQVDGPGADPAPGKLPLPLAAMDFSLTDQDGRNVGPETLIGQPSLVFFGFTYCPDVCPTTLSDISGWLDELGPEAENLNTVFITVDRIAIRLRPWPSMSRISIRRYRDGRAYQTRSPPSPKASAPPTRRPKVKTAAIR